METTVQLNGRSPSGGQVFSECEGFLVGPHGEVWDLYPRIGYQPRLLLESRDGLLSLPRSAEPGGKFSFRITHQSRFLSVWTVEDALLPERRVHDAKNGRFGFSPSALGVLLHDLAVDGGRRVDIAVRVRGADGQWTVGADTSPYLLVCPRSADSGRLLAFARSHDLTRSPRGWPAIVPAPRGRLSGLAERRLALS